MSVTGGLEMLDKAIYVARLMREMESNGFFGFSNNKIQVREHILDEIPGEVFTENRDCTKWPYEISKMYKGYIFFCLAKQHPNGCPECGRLEDDNNKQI